jgi:hypothetical protein
MADKEAAGRFLRTLLGLFTVSWVVVALVAPPDPFTFLLWLVPSWVLATVVATVLAYGGGYDYLRASDLYDPGVKTSSATGAFVILAVVLKLLFTFAADLVLGAATVGYAEGVAAGVVALVVAYVVVFVAGAVVWFR